MTLLLLGVNHRTAGLDNRESLAFGPEEAGALLSALGTGGAIREAAVLSTCNRTEFYVAATEVTAADRQLQAVVREVQAERSAGSRRSPLCAYRAGRGVASLARRVRPGFDGRR